MITSVQYVADADGNNIALSVVNDDVTSTVPLSGGNWLLSQVQDWVAAGNVIAPAAPIPNPD